MSTGRWSNESDHEAMLRRIAIVLDDLPQATVLKIIGSLDPSVRREIRQTMDDLSDVDPLERQRALQLFRTSLQQQKKGLAKGSDLLQLTTSGSIGEVAGSRDGRRINAESKLSNSDELQGQECPVSQEDFSSHLSFLNQVDSQLLATLLGAEHPQTIAIVLASISPTLAAKTVPQMGLSLQRESLDRISRLGEIPQAAFEELAEHFSRRLKDKRVASSSKSGQMALKAILDVMPQTSLTTPNGPVDADAISYRHAAVADVTGDESAADLEALNSQVFETTAAGMDSIEVSLPLASQKESNQGHMTDQWSAEQVHEHLLKMKPKELCHALGCVPTHEAILALCGLPNRISNNVLAFLPKEQVRSVQDKMNSMQSMSLHEIDDAKRSVVKTSLLDQQHPSLHVASA